MAGKRCAASWFGKQNDQILFGNDVLPLKEKQFSTTQQRENLNVITWPKGILCKHFVLENLVAEYFYCMSHDNIVN